MSKQMDNNEEFIAALEKISKRVEKMPTWKKEGWAVLDEKRYHCGSMQEPNNSSPKSTSSYNSENTNYLS